MRQLEPGPTLTLRVSLRKFGDDAVAVVRLGRCFESRANVAIGPVAHPLAPHVPLQAVHRPLALTAVAQEPDGQVGHAPPRLPPRLVAPLAADVLADRREPEGRRRLRAEEELLQQVSDELEQDHEPSTSTNHLTIKEIIAKIRTKVKYYRIESEFRSQS